MLGGGGSDLIEGRGGNDIIDGDACLHVELTRDANGKSPPAARSSARSCYDQARRATSTPTVVLGHRRRIYRGVH